VYWVVSYRSTRTVVVELKLEPIPGMEPWRAVRAELVGPGRRALRVKPPWQREPLQYEAEDLRVVIEAEATKVESRGTFTLKVWNEDRSRSIVLSGVTFP
jgi:uncharacterized protein (TIGR02268 family)